MEFILHDYLLFLFSFHFSSLILPLNVYTYISYTDVEGIDYHIVQLSSQSHCVTKLTKTLFNNMPLSVNFWIWDFTPDVKHTIHLHLHRVLFES